MRIPLFLIVCVVLISACKSNSFKSKQSEIRIGLFDQYSFARKTGFWAEDTYLHLSSDSVLSERFNNALGYHLQQKGYTVFNTANYKDSGIYVVRNLNAQFKQRRMREYVSGPNGEEGKIVLQALYLKSEFELINPEGGKYKRSTKSNNSTIESYQANGAFEFYTSLWGLLTGNRQNKCRYLGNVIPLEKTVMIELVENAAEKAAARLHRRIKRDWKSKN